MTTETTKTDETDSTVQDLPVEQTDTDPEDADGKVGAEAARYRRRLRDTESERDGIAERLAGYQRREAERLAGDVLAKPSDLWLEGRELADLLDDDGQVDRAKVEAEVTAVTAERPGLVKGTRRPRPDDAQGQPVHRDPSGDWQAVLRGAKR